MCDALAMECLLIAVLVAMRSPTEAFCPLDIKDSFFDSRLPIIAGSSCCSDYAFYDASVRHEFQCIEKCFLFQACYHIFYDTITGRCMLFGNVDASMLISEGYMSEAPPGVKQYFAKISRIEMRNVSSRGI